MCKLCSKETDQGSYWLEAVIYDKDEMVKVSYNVYYKPYKKTKRLIGIISTFPESNTPNFIKMLFSIPDLTDTELAIWKFRRMFRNKEKNELSVLKKQNGVILSKLTSFDDKNMYGVDEVSYIFLKHDGVQYRIVNTFVKHKKPKKLLGLMDMTPVYESTVDFNNRVNTHFRELVLSLDIVSIRSTMKGNIR